MDTIKNLLSKINRIKPKIDVVGDCMLDLNFKVKINRISPEHPGVCVMNGSSNPYEITLGGAANVARQINDFAKVCLYCFSDQEFYKLSNKIIKISPIYLTNDNHVPIKRRFCDGDHQVANRWDTELINYGLDDKTLSDFQKYLFSNVGYSDATILSDYGKGIFEKNNPVFLKRPINVVVDPKNPPLLKWRGLCDVFKPNRQEAYNLSNGLSDWKLQCDYFQKNIGCRSVIITQEGDGVVGKVNSDYFEYTPENRVVAIRTSGAGDCFVGFFSIAIASGLSDKEAAVFAFHVGQKFVSKQNNNPITIFDLINSKIISSPEIFVNRNFKLVWTNGCFDVIHAGHIACLKFAKSKGDRLIVGINTDSSVKKLKGDSRPINCLQDRLNVLESIDCVDYIIPFNEDTPIDIVKIIKPDIIVKSDQYKIESVVGKEICPIVLFPNIPNLSSTITIKKMTNCSELDTTK
jgi:D-beta-D-heptose 7-phosphate kinase/D-beta-D-heptose 1-phosphate adenosyltransferase